MTWEPKAKEIFDQLIAKVPIFMRNIAEEKVTQKAEALLKEGGRVQITEDDIIKAFFLATPYGFHGPLKTDMEALGIDYRKHENT